MPFAFHSFVAFCIASQESQGLGPLNHCIPWLQPRSMKRDHASFVKNDGTANLTEIPRKEIREQTDADRSALGQLAPPSARRALNRPSRKNFFGPPSNLRLVRSSGVGPTRMAQFGAAT